VWQLPARWFAWHGYCVLAIDLPGHGRSQGPALRSIGDMATWVGKLLDGTMVRKAALVGHSMGGAIALEAAALDPRVIRIALVGTAGSVPVSADLLTAAREAPERAYRMMTAWSHSTAAKLGGHPVPGLWMTGGSLALFARNGAGTLHTDLAACSEWRSGKDAARRIQCPALVVIAANDRMSPARNGRELADAIAGCRTVTIADCGHMLMAEAPDAVLDALRRFFGSSGPA
jgi:pimeloyl-ACP methyl ester carboxylesterase